MTHKLKILALALMATFAIGAVAVSAAQAAPTFTAHEYPATITGSGVLSDPIVTIETGIEFECETIEVYGTLNGASSTLTLEPKYTDCKLTVAGGFVFSASVVTTSCDLLFHVKETEPSASDYTGTFDVICTESKAITMTAGTCEVKVEPQNGIGPITFTNDKGNSTPEDDFTFQSKNKETLAYNKTKDGFLCPLDGTGKKTDGSYGGTVTVNGEKETSPFARIGISVSD